MQASTQQPRTALSHPLFWSALVGLLVNDHVLKPAHVLPGLVAGKLSDFAGMLVAPVVLTVLLRVRGGWGRMAAFAAVASVFVAIKLSRSCADLVEGISRYTPVPWRIWCDPTDLVALSMLPLAWWLCGRTETRMGASCGRGVSRPKVCLRAAGLLLALVACAATSSSERRFTGTAFLFNGTLRPHNLRLYRLQGPLDCARPLDAPATWPGPDAFVLRSCPMLLSRDIVGLDQGWRDLGAGSGWGEFSAEPSDAAVSGPSCDAVLLAAEGLHPVVITWRGVAPIVFTGSQFFGENANDDHGLVLEQAGERLFIAGTSLVRVLPAGFEPPPGECPNGER